MKFEDMKHAEEICAEVASQFWPQYIIKFYEEKLEWVENALCGSSTSEPVEAKEDTSGDADEVLCKFVAFCETNFGVLI